MCVRRVSGGVEVMSVCVRRVSGGVEVMSVCVRRVSGGVEVMNVCVRRVSGGDEGVCEEGEWRCGGRSECGLAGTAHLNCDFIPRY